MKLRLATRGSKLALAQAAEVSKALENVGVKTELVIVKTKGDLIKNMTVKELGKGTFEKEVNAAVLRGEADVAVHSLKDVPTSGVPLSLAAALPRASPWDVLVSSKPLKDLPPNSKVGTSSSRRKGAILRLRNDLQLVDIRGNLDTRLDKMEKGFYDALVTSEAALHRLGVNTPYYKFSLDKMVPAAGQGAIAVFAKEREIIRILQKINDQRTLEEVSLERKVLEGIGASCLTPIGVFVHMLRDTFKMSVGFYGPKPFHLDLSFHAMERSRSINEITSKLREVISH